MEVTAQMRTLVLYLWAKGHSTHWLGGSVDLRADPQALEKGKNSVPVENRIPISWSIRPKLRQFRHIRGFSHKK